MPGMLQSMGHRESDMTELLNKCGSKINVLSFFLDIQNDFISQSFWQFGVASQLRTQ